MLETKIKTYYDRKEAEQDINRMSKDGWQVVNFQVTSQSNGWDCCGTCCLGSIFLPLALLGRKKNDTIYTVTYVKEG